MPAIQTLGGLNKRKHFSYEGDVNCGIVLNFTGKPRIKKEFFQAILNEFRGKTIRGGFNMTNPPPGGLGDWVQKNSGHLNTRRLTPRHASFIAAVLVYEGFITSYLEGNAVHLKFEQN